MTVMTHPRPNKYFVYDSKYEILGSLCLFVVPINGNKSDTDGNKRTLQNQ